VGLTVALDELYALLCGISPELRHGIIESAKQNARRWCAPARLADVDSAPATAPVEKHCGSQLAQVIPLIPRPRPSC